MIGSVADTTAQAPDATSWYLHPKPARLRRGPLEPGARGVRQTAPPNYPIA
jgi:hypothetical protein